MNLHILLNHFSVKWVFFDLDDTLFDFAKNSEIALHNLYDNFEYLSELFPDYNVFSDTYHIANDRLWQDYHHARIDSQTLKRERFLSLLRDRGVEPDPLLADRWNDYYLNSLGRQSHTIDGAHEVLQNAARKYMIGVLSNGFSNVQYHKLRSTGLWRYVQRMVLSDEIGVNKPDERLFRYAEAAVGATPQQCVLIGDNPDADIVGAINAGWKAIYFNRHGKPAIVPGVPEVDSLNSIIF